MKAVLCKKLGSPEDLVYDETPALTAKSNEVIISVKACGVNFPDTLIIEGKYQFQPELPFSPGGEVAGIIKSVGTDVTHLKVGNRVMAGTSWGGYAEEARSLATNAFPIPEEMDFETAAASMMTYGTSYHALVNRAQLKSGETLLVLGAAGGVGTAAMQIGKALCAKVIAAASTDVKLAFCRQQGADEVINYSTEDLKLRVKELTNGKGADVIYDPVGGKWAESAFRSIAWNGRYLVVGFASGEIPKLPFNLPLLKGASIVGVFWGGFFRNEPATNQHNMAQLTQWFKSGLIKTHIHAKYPLKDAAKALQAISNKKVLGKVILVV